MPKNKTTPYLIAYDIGNPKRLLKVHYFLKKCAIPLQYSVFFATLTNKQRDQILEDLDCLIVDAEDDVRLYPLPDKPEWTNLGVSIWPDSLFGQKGLPSKKYHVE